MPIKPFTKKSAAEFARKFKVDLSVVPLEEFHTGLNIEREHTGIISKATNITMNNPDNVVKIALAHLIEDPRYYYFLAKQEARREKYWEHKRKPSIFTKK